MTGPQFPHLMLLAHEQRIAKLRYKARLREFDRPSDLPKHLIDHEWRKKFEDEREAGTQPKVTFLEAVCRYLEVVAPLRIDPRRLGALRSTLYDLAEEIGVDVPVDKITTRHLSRCRDYLLKLKYKPNTVNRYVSAVSAVLSTCRENWLLIDRVPVIKKLKIKLSYRYLREDEEQLLLANCPPHLRRLVQFILGTGARKSEAVWLTWDDVHRAPDQNRTWVRFRMTKNGKPHSVPLPRSIERMLEDMKRHRPANTNYVFTIIPGKNARIPSGRAVLKIGQPAHYRWPDNDFRRARDRAGLKDVTIHSLRHTYASRLIMKGVPIYEVSKLLNHCGIEQTMRYAHMDLGHLEASVQVLDVPTEITTVRDGDGQYRFGI